MLTVKVMFEQGHEGGEGVSTLAPRRKSIPGQTDLRAETVPGQWSNSKEASRVSTGVGGGAGWGGMRGRRWERLGREGLLPFQCCRWRADVIGNRFLKGYASQCVDRLKSKVQRQEVGMFQVRRW